MSTEKYNVLVKQRMTEIIQQMVDEGYAGPELVQNPTALFLIKELAKMQLEAAELKKNFVDLKVQWQDSYYEAMGEDN